MITLTPLWQELLCPHYRPIFVAWCFRPQRLLQVSLRRTLCSCCWALTVAGTCCVFKTSVCLLPLSPWRAFLPAPSPPKSCVLGHLPNLGMWNCFFSCLDSSNLLTNWLEGVPGKLVVTVTRKVVSKPWRLGDPGTAPGFSTARPPCCVDRRDRVKSPEGKTISSFNTGNVGAKRVAKYLLSISTCFWLYLLLPGVTEKLQW